jgi:WD40 repeat protein
MGIRFVWLVLTCLCSCLCACGQATSVRRQLLAPEAVALVEKSARQQNASGTLMLLSEADRVLGVHPAVAGRIVAVTSRDVLTVEPRSATVVKRVTLGATATAANLSEQGTRALLTLGGEIQLWSLDPIRKIATLVKSDDRVTSTALSPDGASVVLGQCREGMPRLPKDALRPNAGMQPADIDMPCGYRLFSGVDGSLVAEIPAPSDELSGLSYSSDARYLVHTGFQKHMVYDLAKSRLALRRLGGRVESGGPSDFEIFQIEGDKLLMSRFGVVEYDDLSTGKVLASQRYDVDTFDVNYLHMRIEGTPFVATVWNDGEKVTVWNFETRTLVKTPALRPYLDGVCFACSIRDRHDGTIALTVKDSPLISLATGKVTKHTDTHAFVPTEVVTSGRYGSVLREHPEASDAVCRYYPKGQERSVEGPGTPTLVPDAFCAHPLIGDGVVTTSEEGPLRIFDLATRNEALAFGTTVESGTHLLAVAREKTFGFRLGFSESEVVWLTQGAAPKRFTGTEASRFEPVVVGGTRFRLSTRKRKEPVSEIVGEDSSGREVFRRAVPGYVYSMLASEELLVIMTSAPPVDPRPEQSKPRPKSLIQTTLLCLLPNECTPMASGVTVMAVAEHSLLLQEERSGPVMVRDTRTGKSTVIAGTCALGVALMKTTKGLRAICLDRRGFAPSAEPSKVAVDSAPTGYRLTVFDSEGAPIAVHDVGVVNGRNSGDPWPGVGNRLLVPRLSTRGVARYGLLDIEAGWVAELVGDARGAIALYADGRYERFGVTTPLDGAMRCLQGDAYLPSAACGEHHEVRGRMDP